MRKQRAAVFAIVATVAGIGPVAAGPTDVVNGNLVNFQSDGAWSWYQDERVIVNNGQIILGSVAAKRQGDFPTQNFTRNPGDIIASTFNISSGRRSFYELHDTLETDDHNAPSFLTLPDGNYLTSYSKHSTDKFLRFRKTTVPGDTNSWGPRIDYQRLATDPIPPSGGNDTTYTNLHYLPSEGTGQGRVYNFFRNRLAPSWDRHFVYSDDRGDSWKYGGQLTGQNSVTVRPYTKYADNGSDKIYFVTTENNGGQNIWAGYVQGGKTYRMNGTIADNNLFDATAPAVNQLTSVMTAGTVVGGTPMQSLWTHDLALDSSGYPVATFRAYANGNSQDSRHFYARWNGTAWTYSQVGRSGSTFNSLDTSENGSGTTVSSSLGVLDSNDPSTVYFSSNVNPQTGAAVLSTADNIQHFEMWKAKTTNGGSTWAYTQLTQNSSVDNVRPTVAKWDSSHSAVLWMRGAHDHWLYSPSTSDYAFDTSIVGLVTDNNRARSKLTYVDANLSNTTLADGASWALNTNYTTSSTGGAADNLWHLRANALLGNGGNLFSANETTPFNENAGVLKTEVQAPAAGEYDVFAMFWSPSARPAEWRLQAALDYDGDGQYADEQMIAFERFSAQHALASDFDSTVLTEEAANRHLYRAFLGTLSVDAGESISVFIDDLANLDAVSVPGLSWPSDNWRTWYDGIALAAVVPEPTGITLASAAGMFLCMARRSRSARIGAQHRSS
ncbi:MAG: BNR-4 repeat-containing protein [Tepidisphaeraceae bacterium]